MLSVRHFLNLICLVVCVISLIRCAHPVQPGGGPKDDDPPQVLRSEPKNRSPNFEGNKFSVTFDEYIELDNISQKVMISPPMGKLPEFKVKGKSIQVKFREELKENTTYSVYFGDAIVDITERNPILNYTYIFSTGDRVDSMSLHGNVIDAFNLQPAQDVYAMLYKDNNDTLPLDSLFFNIQPYYVSKTDVNGDFHLNGLADEPYLLVALTDLNGNYFYDQPGETIGFNDSLLMPQYLKPIDIDTLLSDSAFMIYDSLDYDIQEKIIDSLIYDTIKKFDEQFTQHELKIFKEADSTQKLFKTSLVSKNIIEFSFAWPADSILIKPLNFSADTTWYIEELSAKHDTVTWFFKNLPIDTLELVVLNNSDTLEHIFTRLDPKRKLPGQQSRKEKKEEAKRKEYLDFTFNLNRNVLKPGQIPIITFKHPVDTILTDSLLLIAGTDSIWQPEFSFADSLHRKVQFPVEYVEGTKYSIRLADSSVIDWNGMHNKESNVNFATRSSRDYGVLVISLHPPHEQDYILQLMSDKENILKEMYFQSDTTITIENLDPAAYILKVIFDDNGNRQWDNGNYGYKIQAEKVGYYNQTISVRANWEMVEDWIIK